MPYFFSRPFWAAATLSLALLGGCASQPSSNTHINDWNNYQRTVAQQQFWQLSAKVGVRSPSENGSAYLNWQQQQDQFDIHISGPLGQGSVRIRGNEQNASLEQAGQATRTASNADDLLSQALGWQAPLSELKFWLRGIPAPGLNHSTLSYTEQGALASMSQSGWQLQYSRHQSYGPYLLPGKISAQRDTLKLTVIIKDWQLQP